MLSALHFIAVKIRIAPLQGAVGTNILLLQELRSSGAERQQHHFSTRIQNFGGDFFAPAGYN